jgi:hypothetical protein
VDQLLQVKRPRLEPGEDGLLDVRRKESEAQQSPLVGRCWSGADHRPTDAERDLLPVMQGFALGRLGGAMAIDILQPLCPMAEAGCVGSAFEAA